MPRPLNGDDDTEADDYLPDLTVHDPFQDLQDEDLPNDKDDGTSMTISQTNINYRVDVPVESSARSTKYSKVKSGPAKAMTTRQLSKSVGHDCSESSTMGLFKEVWAPKDCRQHSI